jgi:hypothetical protein
MVTASSVPSVLTLYYSVILTQHVRLHYTCSERVTFFFSCASLIRARWASCMICNMGPQIRVNRDGPMGPGRQTGGSTWSIQKPEIRNRVSEEAEFHPGTRTGTGTPDKTDLLLPPCRDPSFRFPTAFYQTSRRVAQDLLDLPRHAVSLFGLDQRSGITCTKLAVDDCAAQTRRLQGSDPIHVKYCTTQMEIDLQSMVGRNLKWRLISMKL